MSGTALTRDKSLEICSHLEETAKMMGVVLTKDIESLGNLEGILLSLKETANASSVKGGCFMAGIYLGEILINQMGGEWEFSDEYEQLMVKVGEQLVFPLDKVKKFIHDPENEGLDFYVRTLVATRVSHTS